MNTPIHLSLEAFGGLLYLHHRGDPNEKGHFNPAPFIQFGSAIELNPYDRVMAGHSVANKDDDDEGTVEHILSPKNAPPSASSSHVAQSYSEINGVILNPFFEK
ncbi:hypothetical protein PVK06_005344 [Gossypium arboreum]|uniref:Uncharacterized protein n=1 Tax=Gossypium arboreum TaxID=29729 RepID=A0ABR0QUE0_GOSAR|nr:hypothetical protein PVK06_005344 [Gossypium arboreum]